MATYALTTIGDTLTGIIGNDTFNATYDAAAGLDTFNDTDIINGSAGIDTLSISHFQDVAITPPDTLWTGISNIEKIVINTTGDGAQTINTGNAFQAAFGTGVDLKTTTSGAGAIDIIMTTFTGMAILKTTSVAGAQTITTGSGITVVTGANSGAGAITIKGVGLTSVTATTTGAGAQSIGDGSGNGANLDSVTATSAGGAQSITSTSTNAVTVAAISAAGTQTIITGAGADTITASTTASVNTIDTGDGNDTITISAIASGNYSINAGAGDDTMTGGAGVDSLIGGSGDDTYYINTTADVITENSGVGEGFDVVYSTVSYTIGANVEDLVLTGTAVINGGGNALNNQLTGNSADNVLSGGSGIDTMTGGLGNDTYTVSDTSDVVVENAGEGTDIVFSRASSYTLAVNAENLILTGIVAINGTGNALNNQLTGNSADNVLSGGSGIDTMIGGLGNDSYSVSDATDVVIENLNEGTDTVSSRAATYTLATNVENLILTGTAAINGGGNALNNQLTGNSADNVLRGGMGEDILVGGLGKDTYNLAEATAATDTLSIATGDSLVSSYDIANAFKLGTGTINTISIDRLDLASTVIATNAAAVNGTDSGTILSHSISNGIISFDDINNYTTPLTITAATNLADVFGYLQANITANNTVAFVSEGNTFVFQDGGVTDTLVELVGVVASSINTSGLATNAVWIV
jgi:Ca2+-binding RTX toxin-like protein